jgi:hypothetical protein
VVDELLEGAQVDVVLIFVSDVQAQDVHVELAGLGEVGDHDFHVGAADDVRGRDGGGGYVESWSWFFSLLRKFGRG